MSLRPTFTTGDIFSAANANILASSIIAINSQTGTAYQPVLTDVGRLVTVTNAASISVTIPANSTTAFAVGDQINICNLGTTVATIVAAVGVTLNSNGGKLILNGQYAVATCLKRDTDTWIVVGNVKA